jgi:plastocyanin
MKKSALILMITCLIVPLSAGTITGTVKWEGKAPKNKTLNMDADPVCAGHHEGHSAKTETLVLGEGNTVANIMVRIVDGLPDKKWDVPSKPAVLNQEGCIYVPHVLGCMVGQEVKILNSDGILHNVNAKAKKNRAFNLGMPKGKDEASKTFSEVEDIQLVCNVHPWMKGFLLVSAHPFFSVTGLDGKFTIENVPDGTYKIEAWHERAGTRMGEVTVSGDTQTIDFTFSRPTKK